MVPRLGDLKLDRPIAIASASGGGMLTGISSPARAVLNPGLVADEVAEVQSPPVAVRLGRLEADRWPGLRVRDSDRVADLYVAPTNRGALTVACYGAESGGACARAASSVRLTGARGYSPLRAATWREGLRAHMGRLATRRSGGMWRLDKAADRAAQARGASSLAAAHRAAARAVAADPAPPGRRGPAAGRGGAGGPRAGVPRLARVARAEDSVAFTAAREAIERRDQRLRRALRTI